ncbi:hypothetical protein H5410_031952 [Solanum commersonii]|uniref:Uncharacterized protein n=1 Tax=Solanum commersonii TaxID=4109 RepID=A0A9J5YNX7_SOLCO|nr:hypothetical protein H5410_031952 [Solanum commersonii]
MKPVGQHDQNDPFSRSNDPKVVLWNSHVNFAKKFHRRLLRLSLWSHLALTSKTAHFNGQTSPREGKTPPFHRISCAIVH